MCAFFDEKEGKDDSGGADGETSRSSRRQSSRNANDPQYKDASSSEEDGIFDDDEDPGGGEVVIADSSDDEGYEKRPPGRKRPAVASAKAPSKKKSAPPKLKSPRKRPLSAKKEKAIANDDDDGKVAAAAAASTTEIKSNDIQINEGIDVIIPHSLLNKHTGPAKNECTLLVQVDDFNEDNNESSNHHLDFHGESGAIGRFEADEEGVILDLKGYQYRGTIRPGPTAMIVALTRDGQFKVEAITDEFVTLDTSTKTNVMAKIGGVVKGDMDETYMVREENVNANKKKGKQGDGEKDDEGEGGKKGTKRKATAVKSGNAPKKMKAK